MQKISGDFRFASWIEAESLVEAVSGAYPWNLAEQWSACLFMLSAVVVVTLAAGFWARFEHRLKGGFVASIGEIAAVLLMIVISAIAYRNAVTHCQSIARLFQMNCPVGLTTSDRDQHSPFLDHLRHLSEERKKLSDQLFVDR